MKSKLPYIFVAIFLVVVFNNCSDLGNLSGSPGVQNLPSVPDPGQPNPPGPTPPPVIPLPLSPSNISVITLSTSQIRVSWRDNSDNETGFKIERATSALGPFNFVATTNPGIATFTDSNLNAASVYYYRVNAFNDGGQSDFSPAGNSTTYPANTNAFVTRVEAIPTGARVTLTGPVMGLRYFHDFVPAGTYVNVAAPYMFPTMDIPITFPAGTTFVCFQALGTNNDNQYWGPFVGDPQQCNAVP